jgi:hypothetical protein
MLHRSLTTVYKVGLILSGVHSHRAGAAPNSTGNAAIGLLHVSSMDKRGSTTNAQCATERWNR